MDLRHLRYFQAVAEERSFSKAARRLRIAQPALSRAVQELERELGAPLIIRDRKKPGVTAAGAVLLRESGLILERVEEAARKVRRTAGGGEGELRLGYIGPPTRSFLPRLLREFSRLHPLVTVVLEERTPERVWEMVSNGRLSVGLTRPVLAHEALGLCSHLLRRERFCAAVPLGHPLAARRSLPWAKLADEPLIILARREGASSHDTIRAACLEAGFEPRLKHTPSVVGTILQYVEAGGGIGVLPESTASPKVRLIPLTPGRFIPLVMVWPQHAVDPVVAAFRSLVVQSQKSGRLWD
jgi:DNA-binding transcriptional LysR family regulator